MSNLLITYQTIRKNEGGYWAGNNGSGETYIGIDRNQNPQSAVWKIVDAYKAKYGVPAWMAYINDPQLDAYVMEFYRGYLGSVVNIESIVNQTLADFTADFIVHKLYDAVTVINAVAARFNPAPELEKYKITPGVLALMNMHPVTFYALLKQYRELYYRNPKQFGINRTFSAASIATFITNRVNSFPATA